MADIVDVLRQAAALSSTDQMEILARLSAGLRRGCESAPAPLSVTVRVDDITRVPADAMVTGLLSNGRWGVTPSRQSPWVWTIVNPRSLDAAINTVAGGQYHRQARLLVEAPEGETLLANRQWLHAGGFEQVLFVVDDWRCSLFDLITGVLDSADRAGLSSLSLPLLRTGAGADQAGAIEEKVADLVRAVKAFRGRFLRTIHLVAGNAELEGLVRQALNSRKASVKVVLGDITRVDADGLILGINSEGSWCGGVDRAIYASSGEQFHRQAAPILIGAPDGEVAIARAQQPHDGAFRSVVFVADNLRLSLYQILLTGLRAADQAGMASVTIPALRMGVMMDYGGPPEQKVLEMAQAVLDFQVEDHQIRDISFVVYGDPVTFEALRAALSRPAETPASDV
jgi:O-acetyl-ADP-ribose deacetylase (regulator of RNase III)